MSVDDIKAWLERWDIHKDDKCLCERCRRKRALRTAVEFVHEMDGAHENICPLLHPAYRNKWCAGCEAPKTLASIRKTLGIEQETTDAQLPTKGQARPK